VFRETVLKTLGRVGSVVFVVVVFLRIKTSVIKTPTKNGIFVKKKSGVGWFRKVGSGCPNKNNPILLYIVC